jgi:thiopeptide-type bacteriocin biosynthesis protein
MATRPRYVAYDLPIGVRPDGNENRSIDPRDVYVGVDRGRFFLWSRSLSREIVVHESHALSPLHCAPGLVCFLSMLARQNVHNNSGLNWGAARQFPFLPRIRVGRLVLSPAQWLLDVETLRAAKDRAEWIRDWRQRWNVPEFVFAKENDNRLLLRLSHPTCADLILASVNDASKRFVRLTEAMSTEMPHWFDGPDGSRDVEFVASFRTVSPQKARARAKASIVDPVIRTRPPHSEWTSIKVPSGTGDHDRLIARFGALASELRRVGYTERWFFLRYSDPRDHIRIRFRCSDGMKAEQDHEVFAFLERLTHDRELSEYSIETYQREVERYGGEVAIDFAEEIFMIDSEAVAHDLLGPGFDAERLGRAVLSCDPLVAAFGTPAVMAEWAEAIPRHESRGSASFHSTLKRLRAELLSRRARLAANPFEMPVGALRSLVGGAPSERSAFRILDSLVHMHFNRNGVVRDEPEALQLQRELYKGLAHTTTDRMVLR